MHPGIPSAQAVFAAVRAPLDVVNSIEMYALFRHAGCLPLDSRAFSSDAAPLSAERRYCRVYYVRSILLIFTAVVQLERPESWNLLSGREHVRLHAQGTARDDSSTRVILWASSKALSEVSFDKRIR